MEKGRELSRFIGRQIYMFTRGAGSPQVEQAIITDVEAEPTQAQEQSETFTHVTLRLGEHAVTLKNSESPVTVRGLKGGFEEILFVKNLASPAKHLLRRFVIGPPLINSRQTE